MKVAMFPISGPSASSGATAGAAGSVVGSGTTAVPPEFLEIAETIFGDKNNMDDGGDSRGGAQKMEKGVSLF